MIQYWFRYIDDHKKASSLPHGTYHCGNCPWCQWVREGQGIRLPNGQWHKSHTFFICSTQGIIYIINGRCGVFYIEKTKLQFGQRIGDHIYYSDGGKIITPVTRHVDLHHKYHTDMVSFFILEVISPDPRGGNWDKRILHLDALWIESLDAMIPPGLN